MTILASDTFQRANQSGLGTASDGQTWALLGSGTMAASISNNEGVLSGANSDTTFRLGSKTTTNAEALLRIMVSDYSGTIIGPALRIVDGLNLYRPRLLNNQATIMYLQNGNPFVVANASFPLTNGTFYWMRYRIVGTTHYLRAWQDGNPEPTGTWTVTATDSTFTSAGGFGVEGWMSAANTLNFDHLTVTDAVIAVDYDLSWRGLISKTSNSRNLSWRALISKTIAHDLSWRALISSPVGAAARDSVTGVVLDGLVQAKVPDGTATGVTPDGKVIGIAR